VVHLEVLGAPAEGAGQPHPGGGLQEEGGGVGLQVGGQLSEGLAEEAPRVRPPKAHELHPPQPHVLARLGRV
jgi:hypothetical protein